MLFVVPGRTKEQNNLLADSWLQWQNEVEKSASQCTKGDYPCLAKVIPLVIENRPRPPRGSDATGLATDLLAGQVMLANSNTRDVLAKRLSIGDKFLGSGFSEPVGAVDYTAARVPEYLVPNLNDKTRYVWVWQLDRAQMIGQKQMMDEKLLPILLKIPPVNHADFAKNWGTWMKQHIDPGDPNPVLIRFAVFDPSKIKVFRLPRQS